MHYRPVMAFGTACGSNAWLIWPEMCLLLLHTDTVVVWYRPEIFGAVCFVSFVYMFLHGVWVFALVYLLIVPHIYEKSIC